MWKLIRAHRTSGTDVVVHARDEESGLKEAITFPFKPYFYVLSSENVINPNVIDISGEYLALGGETLKRVYTKNPSDVPTLRQTFKKHWEADIPYARRFLVDSQVTDGFDIVGDNLIPKPVNIPVKIGYIDIEVYSDDKMPDKNKDAITCVTIGCQYKDEPMQYVSFLLDDYTVDTLDGNWVVWRVETEAKLLEGVAHILKEMDFDVLTGWNIDFDREYLEDRCKSFKIELPLDGTCVFDLLSAYKGLYRQKSYRLKDIMQYEALTDMDEEKVNYGKLWEIDKPKLLERNRRHVQWVWEIDRKRKIIDYWWEMKQTAGLEDLKDVFYNSVLIDTMLLRRSPWIFPSKEEHEKEAYEGAYVMEPPKGISKNIAVFDLSRFYPSILLSEKLDPYILLEYKKVYSELDWAKYKEFAQDKPSLMLSLVEEMVAERIKLQKSEHKEKLASIKAVLNSVYGVLGSPHYRLYMPEIASRITETARNTIKQLAESIKSWGYPVIYCDTDSAWCQIDESKTTELEQRINDSLGDFNVKLEHYFTAVFFAGKKRYSGLEESGELYFAGFEQKRSDSSSLTKDLQEHVFRMVLEGKDGQLVQYLKDRVESVKKAPLKQLSITKTLRQDPEDGYKKQAQDYILAIRKSPWLKNLVEGDAVNIVPAKNYQYGVAVFQDEGDLPKKVEVDYDKVIDKQIRAKIEDALEAAGHSWSEIAGQGKLF